MSRSSSSQSTDPILVRWCDRNQLRREEPAEMLEIHQKEAVLSSSVEISEATRVYLIGNHYSEIGIVRSCQGEGSRFIVTIGIGSDPGALLQSGSERDPGVLVVDDFITEEQELQILSDLQQELESCTSAPSEENGSGGGPEQSQGTAAFALLRRFYVGSSTVLGTAALAELLQPFRAPPA